ncbi:putative ADP-ribosylation factor GTPase-activating protein [Trichinella pseudospiralis]
MFDDLKLQFFVTTTVVIDNAEIKLTYVCATELFKIPNLILPERHQKVQSSTNRSLLLSLLFWLAIEWQSQPIRPACLAQFEFSRSSGPCEAGRFLKSSLQPFGGQLELDHCQSVPLPMLVSTNMIIAKRIKLVSRSAQRALGRGAKQMPVKSSFYADKKPPQPVPLVPGSVA